MMNKKGFVLMETIVVMAVLTVGLISLYTSYATILSKANVRSTHDNVQHIYQVDVVRRYFMGQGPTWIRPTNLTHYQLPVGWTAASGPNGALGGLYNIMNRFNIEKVYVFRGQPTDAQLRGLDGATISYVRSQAHWQNARYQLVIKVRIPHPFLNPTAATNGIFVSYFASLEYS